MAPLRLEELRGKKSTPNVWLGGTGEFFVVDKHEQERQEQESLRKANKAKVCS